MTIIPGETSSFWCQFDVAPTNVNKVIITLKQKEVTVLEKAFDTASAVEGEDNACRVTVNLTQEETLMFKDKVPVRAQGNVIVNGTERRASNIPFISIGEQLHPEVIS